MMNDHRCPALITATLVLALFSVPSALGETPKFQTVLYGASYYHEYMPYERLEKDVELMEKAGITFARVGESTWGVMEPRDGEFDFA
jgi:beta-galactosidase